MTARGAAGRCPPTTWLGPRLLLVCLLVSRSITEEESKHCSHMIGDGHLQLLQQMIDSQMETSCKIPFQFVNEAQLQDHVCYIKKAFFLAQDILENTISFKDNTSNAIALVKLQELSVGLEDCFPLVHEEQETACVQNFSESPLWALEKIKNVFNETKNLLKMNQSIFSKNCSDSFAKCSVPGYPGSRSPQDALSVPSRDRLDLKSEHHSNSPSAGTGCTRAPYMSSSLRLVSCVPSSVQPCSPRQGLKPCHPAPASGQVQSPCFNPKASSLGHSPAPAVPACGCGPCCAWHHLAPSSQRSGAEGVWC